MLKFSEIKKKEKRKKFSEIKCSSIRQAIMANILHPNPELERICFSGKERRKKMDNLKDLRRARKDYYLNQRQLRQALVEASTGEKERHCL